MKNKKATIYDVAKLACVSLATASRVINGIDKVSLDTKQRVLDAIKQLNYKPNVVAVELASMRNTNVAIIVPEINYTYVSNVVAGLMEQAKEIGYDCLIFTTKDTKSDVTKTISKVLSLRPNGIVLFNDSLSELELSELIQFDIPLVSLGVSNCSHIATLYPLATNLEIYTSAAWWGTPHIGALSACPQSLPVKVSSNSLEAVIASSKNIS